MYLDNILNNENYKDNIYYLRIKIKSKIQSLKINGNKIEIHVTCDAKNNLANDEILTLLTKHFKTNNIHIIKGLQSSNKIALII